MSLVIIAHNIRSAHNVGAILRTADGFGVKHVYCTGYTPYPAVPGDTRLPHLRARITAQIHKTALGAEQTVPLSYCEEAGLIIKQLRSEGFKIAALEQSPQAIPLPQYTASGNIALLLGEEVHGVDESLLSICDDIIEIPMRGRKESFNVSVAAGIAMYALTQR